MSKVRKKGRKKFLEEVLGNCIICYYFKPGCPKIGREDKCLLGKILEPKNCKEFKKAEQCSSCGIIIRPEGLEQREELVGDTVFCSFCHDILMKKGKIRIVGGPRMNNKAYILSPRKTEVYMGNWYSKKN